MFYRPFERHICGRTSATSTEHLDERRSILDLYQPHFAAVHVDAGANLVDSGVDTFLDGGFVLAVRNYDPYPFMSSCMREAILTASAQSRCHMFRPKISPTQPASIAIFAL